MSFTSRRQELMLVALVWTPHWQAPDGSVTPAWT
jgi:hypothetical protein